MKQVDRFPRGAPEVLENQKESWPGCAPSTNPLKPGAQDNLLCLWRLHHHVPTWGPHVIVVSCAFFPLPADSELEKQLRGHLRVRAAPSRPVTFPYP